MKPTGKCKEDFEKWYRDFVGHYYIYEKELQDDLILFGECIYSTEPRMRRVDPLSREAEIARWNYEHPDDLPIHFEEVSVEELIKRYPAHLTEEQIKKLRDGKH